MEWIYGNRYLSLDEMRNNALIVSSYFRAKGWSLNAIAGVLGNMEAESSINPGIWQSLNEGNMSGGYGLVQWTPATNYISWAEDKGYSITDGYAQLRWIDEETTTFGQWIPTSEYPMSFEEFKTSNSSAQDLASAFLKNFERAGVEVENTRRANALIWYLYILGNNPDIPIPGDPDNPPTPSNSKRKKFNFILFNRNRRKTVL